MKEICAATFKAPQVILRGRKFEFAGLVTINHSTLASISAPTNYKHESIHLTVHMCMDMHIFIIKFPSTYVSEQPMQQPTKSAHT